MSYTYLSRRRPSARTTTQVTAISWRANAASAGWRSTAYCLTPTAFISFSSTTVQRRSGRRMSSALKGPLFGALRPYRDGPGGSAWVDIAPSLFRRGTSAVCAKRTTGVDELCRKTPLD